ncbi:Sedlin, N-terminal conserved region-domain-containing protein [Xylaria palmicola]|nr:Sedlin, N-terminal conserved region-domain-containing protein [Xylaria palmicola]
MGIHLAHKHPATHSKLQPVRGAIQLVLTATARGNGEYYTLNSLLRRHRAQFGDTARNTDCHDAQNNPLHITIFPSYDATTQAYSPVRTPLQFSLLLSGTLDVFEARSRHTANPAAGGMLLSGDFGLLHAVDDRLAAYGFETNTGVKLVAVVDMRGRLLSGSATSAGAGAAAAGGNGGSRVSRPGGGGGGAAAGLRDSELKPVFRAVQTAYVRLLQNPFYDPDETTLLAGAKPGAGAKRITSRKFGDEMRRIGEAWAPGVVNL